MRDATELPLYNVPCPKCAGTDTDCYDGYEQGNTYICNRCAANFFLTVEGTTECHGTNIEYTRDWRKEHGLL